MVYISATVVDADDFKAPVKMVASDMNAYNEWKTETESNGFCVTDEFIDADCGTICILPEDFRY